MSKRPDQKSLEDLPKIKAIQSKDDYKEKWKEGIEYFDSILCTVKINNQHYDNDMDESLFYFISDMTRRPINMGGSPAAVTVSEHYIELLYDPIQMLQFTPKQIEYILFHEFGHIVNGHLTRCEEIRSTLRCSVKEFQTRYVKYADLPVNKTLSDHKEYNSLNETVGMATYDSFDIPLEYDTFEKICMYVNKNNINPPSDQEMPKMYGPSSGEEGSQNSDGDGSQSSDSKGEGSLEFDKTDTIVEVGPGGKSKVIQEGTEDGRILVVSPVIENSKFTETEISNMIENTKVEIKDQALFGNFRTTAEEFIKKSNEVIDNTWLLLKNHLIQLGNSKKLRTKSARRLNKKTKQPKGKTKTEGFNVMMIVDESGSMSDSEVNFLLGLAQKSSLTESNDKLYVARWCTELCGEIQQVNSYSESLELKREYYGGTDFTEVFSNDKIRSKDVDAYIFATDGEVGNYFPKENPNKPIFYIITTEHGVSNFENHGKFGDYLFVSNKLIEKAMVNG